MIFDVNTILGFSAFAVPAVLLWWLYGRVLARSLASKPVELSVQPPLTLLFTSDVGTGDERQCAVARQLSELAVAHGAAAVILAGDNFMDFGVRSVDDPQWNAKFEAMYDLPGLRTIPFFAVLGNHDYKGRPKAQIAYLGTSGRWRMPARHYRICAPGLVEIAAIDTNFPDRTGAWLFPLDRLERAMARSRAPWKLVVGHRPLMTGGKYERIAWHVRFILSRFLHGAQAQVYVSGHDHNLQHLEFRIGHRTVHQIVCGAGGSELKNVRSIPGHTSFARSAHGTVLARFTRSEAVFQFFETSEREPVHEFRLHHDAR